MNNLEELKQELVETKNKCAEIEKKINELEKQTNEVRWRADGNELYYYFYGYGEIVSAYDYRDKRATDKYNLGNYFKTKEEAEKTIEKIKIYTQLKDLALRLNRGEEIDWKNCKQSKYNIFYNCDLAVLGYCSACLCQDIGQIYCVDENFLDIAKQEIGEENLKKLFEQVRIC